MPKQTKVNLNQTAEVKPLAVTPAVAAKMLGRSYGTLANWRSTGTGPRYARNGQAILYRVADLEAWLDDHMVGA